MTRILRNLLWALLVLHGEAFAANPPSVPPAFTTALYETRMGSNAAQAYFLVNLMRSAEAPKADQEALRRELMHIYLDQITGAAPIHPAPAPQPGAWAWLKRQLPGKAKAPQDGVAAAIARGRTRDSVLDAPFRAAWQSALTQAFALRWEDGAKRAPYFTLEMRDMQPIAPGIWAAPSAEGQLRLMLSLRLANTSAVPLPIYRPDIILQGTLRFACNWDRPVRTQSVMQANEVTLLQPGAESDPLVCEAPPAAAYWRQQLPALLAANSKAGLAHVLVPHDLDDAGRLYHLELALANAAPQYIGWSQRLRVARQEAGREWSPAKRALDPPESSRFSATPYRDRAATGDLLKWFLGATVLALGMFMGGRTLRRLGVPQGVVAVITVLVVAGLWALITASLGGGTGYSHPLYVGLAVGSGYLGPVLLGVLALHGLHKLLDAEEMEWWQAVATGWRRALDVTSETSRAEFWGFLAHCAWLWMLARVCLAPLDYWAGLALLVPVLTLTFRRVRSLSRHEWLEVGLIVACLLLLVVLPPRSI
jgi:hypothetical protein